MKILMIQTQVGSPDGVTLETYREGEEYDLSSTERECSLAEVFVREGWATSNEDAKRAATVPDARPEPFTKRGRR